MMLPMFIHDVSHFGARSRPRRQRRHTNASLDCQQAATSAAATPVAARCEQGARRQKGSYTLLPRLACRANGRQRRPFLLRALGTLPYATFRCRALGAQQSETQEMCTDIASSRNGGQGKREPAAQRRLLAPPVTCVASDKALWQRTCRFFAGNIRNAVLTATHLTPLAGNAPNAVFAGNAPNHPTKQW